MPKAKKAKKQGKRTEKKNSETNARLAEVSKEFGEQEQPKNISTKKVSKNDTTKGRRVEGTKCRG